MIRVVLDANTLASGAVAQKGTTLAEITDRWVNEEYEVVLSQEIITELRHTLPHPISLLDCRQRIVRTTLLLSGIWLSSSR
jgi:predicted nucleic acid-binding protein